MLRSDLPQTSVVRMGHDRVVGSPVTPRPESTTDAGTMDGETQPKTLHRHRSITGPRADGEYADERPPVHSETQLKRPMSKWTAGLGDYTQDSTPTTNVVILILGSAPTLQRTVGVANKR